MRHMGGLEGSTFLVVCTGGGRHRQRVLGDIHTGSSADGEPLIMDVYVTQRGPKSMQEGPPGNGPHDVASWHSRQAARAADERSWRFYCGSCEAPRTDVQLSHANMFQLAADIGVILDRFTAGKLPVRVPGHQIGSVDLDQDRCVLDLMPPI